MNLTEVSKNTFWIRIKIPIRNIDSILTAFSFKYMEKPYLVTALHALQYEIKDGTGKVNQKLHELTVNEEIDIKICGTLGFQESKKVRFIASGFHSDDGSGKFDLLKNIPGRDVLVFSPLEDNWLSSSLLTEVDPMKMNIGANVYFLGFPSLGIEFRMDGKFPSPLVRGGYLAGYTEECKVIFLDAHNCYGFSGGPVVFNDPSKGGFHVFGIISGFFKEQVEVGSISNSGVTICSPISYVIELLNGYLEIH